MTDNDIVKALECCDGSFDRCEECPLDNVSQDKLRCWELEKSALDLINRQQAEIERLKAYYKDEFERLTITYIQLLEKKTQEIKAEAYKEFAEWFIREYPETEYFVSNLLKEMEGDNCGV